MSTARDGLNVHGVVTLTVAAVILYAAGVIGIAYVAGFGLVWHRLNEVNPVWVLAAFGGIVVSWLGYYIGFHGIAAIPGGPDLTRPERIAVVAVGFGSFLVKGGAVVDNYAMKRGGSDRRVANVRVSALKSLEHAPIAVGTCIAAIILLALGRADPPPLDFTWPWAIGPIVGGAIAMWLAARFRERLRDRKGFLQSLGVALDGIWMLRELAFGGKSRGLPLAGMTLFWVADIFALWAALQACSEGISFAGIIIGYAVGYVLTRRSAPLGGAGLIDLVLPLTLWDCGASFAGAVVAVIVYRFFSLWVPLPAAFAGLSTVRGISDVPVREAEPALQGT
jgi:uncharacterized membrane protein YbhN (UPF0104 family)